ncbi:MAG: hypothetical protein H8D26_02015 [Methanomicrobia archaeon]|nr:hypothetical protein [Methanomicrobia archaeon]
MSVSSNTVSRLVFGAGTVSVGGTDLGATDDGVVFRIEQEIYEPHFNGVYGPLKGSLHRTRLVAYIEVTIQEFKTDTLAIAIPGLTSTTAGDSSSEELSDGVIACIAAAQYQTVIWTGEDCDGDAITITLENAISTENMEVSFQDTEEAKIRLTFMSTYSANDPGHIPFSVVVATS